MNYPNCHKTLIYPFITRCVTKTGLTSSEPEQSFRGNAATYFSVVFRCGRFRRCNTAFLWRGFTVALPLTLTATVQRDFLALLLQKTVFEIIELDRNWSTLLLHWLLLLPPDSSTTCCTITRIRSGHNERSRSRTWNQFRRSGSAVVFESRRSVMVIFSVDAAVIFDVSVIFDVPNAVFTWFAAICWCGITARYLVTRDNIVLSTEMGRISRK